MIKFIYCVDIDCGFSKNGSIPWNHPNELSHFYNKTINKIVIYGHNTYLDMGKILTNRRNIILSHKNLIVDGAEIVNTIDDIMSISKNNDIWVIGGKEIFDQLIDFANLLVVSVLNKAYGCDVIVNHHTNPNFKLHSSTNCGDFNINEYKRV